MTAEGWLEPPPLPHHYDTIENHQNALRFGMWLFLGTEVLLFAGIFVGYFVFRTYFPEAFEQAATHLSLFLGTLNTFLLLTSSLTVAIAHHNAEHGKNRNAFWLLTVLGGHGRRLPRASRASSTTRSSTRARSPGSSSASRRSPPPAGRSSTWSTSSPPGSTRCTSSSA